MQSGQFYYIVLNILLLLVLTWNIWRTYKEHNQFFLQPAVLTSGFHFILTYSFPNFYYSCIDDAHELANRLPSDIFPSMNRAMLGINLAAISLWSGYRSPRAQGIAISIRNWLSEQNLLKFGNEINFSVLMVLFIISAATPIIQIQLGTFGYFADAEGLKASQSLSQWLAMLSSCGKLCLLILAFAVCLAKYKKNPFVWTFFLTVLIFHVFVGLCSGFKGAVFIPFLIVIVGGYLATRKISVVSTVCLLIAVVMSFQIIEPLRRARLAMGSQDNRDVSTVLTVCMQSFARTLLEPQTNIKNDFSIDTLVKRLDLTTVTAVAIDFSDNGDSGAAETPPFLKNIFLSPLNAFIPRFLWESKTVTNDGWWFNVYVLGNSFDVQSSVGMGPVSYLYFCGGFIGVVVGFWLIGFVQKVAFSCFIGNEIGSLIIFLGMLFQLVMIDSNIAAATAGIIRLVPFLIAAQFLVTRHVKGES